MHLLSEAAITLWLCQEFLRVDASPGWNPTSSPAPAAAWLPRVTILTLTILNKDATTKICFLINTASLELMTVLLHLQN